MVITALGHAMGYRVGGLGDWRRIVLPGQLNPCPDGGEQVIPYLDRRSTRADYVWRDAHGRCVAVFETDGRDNNPRTHLRITADAVEIKPHPGTNNFYKLSHPVLQRCFGYVPPLRFWVLFQVDNDFSPKNPWVSAPTEWNALVARCRNTADEAGLLPQNPLDGLRVMADTGLLADAFLESVLAGHSLPLAGDPAPETLPVPRVASPKPVLPVPVMRKKPAPVTTSGGPVASGLVTGGEGAMGQLGLALVRRYMHTPRAWAEVLRDLGHTASGSPVKPGAKFLAQPSQVRDRARYYPDTFRTSDGVTFVVSREWQRCYFENLVVIEQQLRATGRLG